MDRRNERGEGRIGLCIALAVCGAAIFAGIQYVPVRIAAYHFHDTLRQEARFAAVRDSVDVVRKRILDQADSLDIPLDADNLTVRKTASEVVVTAAYEKPIDLKVTKYTYRFSATERAPLF